MSSALTPPFAIAALVLCVAGSAKLRRPAAAVTAARIAGLPGSALLVRAFAAFELVLGGWCLIQPTRVGTVAIALTYGSFMVLGAVLVRRHAACGCFGEGDAPASALQALLSAALALVALGSSVAVPHGVAWIFGRQPDEVVAVALGVAAAVYGVVIAYTELPRAWTAWGGT